MKPWVNFELKQTSYTSSSMTNKGLYTLRNEDIKCSMILSEMVEQDIDLKISSLVAHIT